MFIQAYAFDQQKTQTEVDDIINNLLLNVQGFSDIACLDGLLWGVKTGCDYCSDCEHCEYEFNACVREHIVRNLVSAQNYAETILGFPLVEKYHTEEIRPFEGTKYLKMKRPGITAVNVTQEVTSLGTFAVSPYIVEGVTLTDSGLGYCIATISSELLDNPEHVRIWDDNGTSYLVQKRTGFPRRSGANWQIALGNDVKSPCTTTLNAQHCRYMILEVDEPTCTGIVHPVYPNSNQKIPLAKPVQSLAGGRLRYWFHPWVLLDPGFVRDGANLYSGEFYKLLAEIELACFTEVESLPTVTMVDQDCNCQTTFSLGTETVSVNIIDEENGYLYIEYGDDCTWIQRWKNACPCYCGLYPLSLLDNSVPFKLEVKYKTEPIISDLFYAKQAIAHLAAAELPLKTCGCSVPQETFISIAQTPYSKVHISTTTGDVYSHPEPGETWGKIAFHTFLKRLNSHKRLLVI